MKYTEVKITFKPYSPQDAEITTALLAEIGFDSFVDFSEGIDAYIPTETFQTIDFNSFFKDLPIQSKGSYLVTNFEDENWNKQWESNFQPISVENLCRVRAPFHQTEKGFKLEIVIEPKMAFGTGHHQTTWLMIRELFHINLNQKKVLDMGCGTGILAIVAEKLGASSVTAIDIDNWAFENAKENIVNNGCTKTKAFIGDSNLLIGETFDIILANINLNVLLSDLRKYYSSLNSSGLLIMSGILKTDIQALSRVAEDIGFIILNQENRNDWMLLSTQKK